MLDVERQLLILQNLNVEFLNEFMYVCVNHSSLLKIYNYEEGQIKSLWRMINS